jgi:hypothetical protein
VGTTVAGGATVGSGVAVVGSAVAVGVGSCEGSAVATADGEGSALAAVAGVGTVGSGFGGAAVEFGATKSGVLGVEVFAEFAGLSAMASVACSLA